MNMEETYLKKLINKAVHEEVIVDMAKGKIL